MKTPDRYTNAAVFLFVLGAVLFVIPLFSSTGDITHAAFVFSAFICLITGTIILVFSGGELLDPRVTGLLTAQGSQTHCLITKQLGIPGNAYFLPPKITGIARVVQFNPFWAYDGSTLSFNGSFKETSPPGLITPPSCDLLIQDLKKRNTMIIPEKDEELSFLFEEVIGDILKFGQRISVRWEENRAAVTVHAYTHIDGCTIMAKASPGCCTMSPCPVCSLCGVLIAEGKNRVVTMSRCSAGPSSKDITAVYSILPLPDVQP